MCGTGVVDVVDDVDGVGVGDADADADDDDDDDPVLLYGTLVLAANMVFSSIIGKYVNLYTIYIYNIYNI